jgi:5-methylcytosine-specific restriction protein A
MGNCYDVTDIPSLERLLVTYLQSEQPMNQIKMGANVPLTEEPTAASLAVSGLELDAEIVKSLALPDKFRQQRLALADRVPRKVTVETTVFLRNPDVVAEVLIRANGLCEICKCSAPFLRRSNALPYLEVHHRTRLADGGEDSVENAVAACPNCHRHAHFW